jgi:glycosyltransferase involved in cell wall biosynthesis
VKLAYVTPRFGIEVQAGAEYAARMFAERLAARPGWEVEAITTCARDGLGWEDQYEPGTVDVNGVTVHRFRSASARSPEFERVTARVLGNPRAATAADGARWVEAQGPVNPSMVEAIEASDADLVAFYPYLYWPTVHGVPAAGRRAIMHPAAHDEAALRLDVFRPIFRQASAFVFQTMTERRLVTDRFGVGATPQLLLGLGVEEQPGDAGAAAVLAGERPYLLYLNRVDTAKGVHLLVRWFAAYKARNPGPLQLVLAGLVAEAPPLHPDVVVTGPVDEPTKWGLLRGAVAVVNPSAYEAFSLLVVEAWMADVPVLVNGRCGPMRENVSRSGGGLWFESYAGFEAAVDRLHADLPLRARLAGAGRAFAEANFRWPTIIERYSSFLTRIADRV